ncbi:hypothetical protein BJ741DRAFT_707926 [Chytriomyces cf. hyalinus JEL632]|nr:hypothetical protein BJ741DRAFT_707926 [Chytriomyces cf. hyalinus JEL632]
MLRTPDAIQEGFEEREWWTAGVLIIADARFLNVKCKTLPVAELKVIGITRLGGLTLAIKDFFSLGCGCGLIHLYDKNNNRIATWAQFSKLPAEYFTEDGSFLTVRTSPPPSMEASNVSELAAINTTEDAPKKQHIEDYLDSNMTARFQAFNTAQVVDGCIVSPGQALLPYPLENFRKLCVRTCYKDVFDLLVEKDKSGLELFAITGTPGTKKSHFFIYILYRLLKHQSRRPSQSRPSPLKSKRVVHQTRSRRYCFDLDNQTVFEVTKWDAKNLVRLSETLYIISGQNTFGYSELIVCRQSCYLDLPIADFHDRLRRYGGSAEYIFNCFRDDLETALADPDAATRVQNYRICTESYAGLHLLLHMIPSADGQYKYSHAALASRYVGEQLWKNHSEQIVANLQQMISNGPFEIWRLDKLDGARVLLGRDLLPSWPILQYHQRSDDDTFPAIDALSPQGMFQFTVGNDHRPQDVEVLNRLCALYDKPKLYFVVPPLDFKNLVEQKYLQAKGWGDVVPIENLEQYVVELPFSQ